MSRAFTQMDEGCTFREDNFCCLCGTECDGSLMRHRQEHTRELIAGQDVPRRKDGGPALCYGCQRSITFAKGLLPYLARKVAKQARYPHWVLLPLENAPEPSDNEETARERFISWRWPRGIRCPECGSASFWPISTRRTFRCRDCKRHFSPTTGTIFSNKKLTFVSILKFVAMREVNPHKLAAELGLTYKTTWALTKRLA